jgi:hypothetical protein
MGKVYILQHLNAAGVTEYKYSIAHAPAENHVFALFDADNPSQIKMHIDKFLYAFQDEEDGMYSSINGKQLSWFIEYYMKQNITLLYLFNILSDEEWRWIMAAKFAAVDSAHCWLKYFLAIVLWIPHDEIDDIITTWQRYVSILDMGLRIVQVKEKISLMLASIYASA